MNSGYVIGLRGNLVSFAKSLTDFNNRWFPQYHIRLDMAIALQRAIAQKSAYQSQLWVSFDESQTPRPSEKWALPHNLPRSLFDAEYQINRVLAGGFRWMPLFGEGRSQQFVTEFEDYIISPIEDFIICTLDNFDVLSDWWVLEWNDLANGDVFIRKQCHYKVWHWEKMMNVSST